MRTELVARIFADTGIRDIFRKIIKLTKDYQDEAIQIKTSNEVMEINPADWSDNTDITIDVGIGAGDRQEKIMNLNFIAQKQTELMMTNSNLADEVKLYNTYNKLVTEVGLKEPSMYFNNPEKPDELLQAQNEQLTKAAQMMQQHIESLGNPLAEAEEVKAQADLMKARATQDLNIAKLEEEHRQFNAELTAKVQAQFDELQAKYTEMELKYNQDIKGKGIE